MKKRWLYLGVALLNLNYGTVMIQAQTSVPEPKAALGATLSDDGRTRTLQILNSQNIDVKTIYNVDGEQINTYLQDGSTKATPVYSSILVEPREAGYGVRVQIMTPDTIQQVSQMAYQQAAITAGAGDVLIKVASVQPVTGEGALTGLYMIYNQLGTSLNKKNVTLAQKEIKLIGKIEQKKELTEVQIQELYTQLKLALQDKAANSDKISEDVMNEVVSNVIKEFEAKHNVTVSNETKKALLEFFAEYVDSEAVNNPTLTDQLKNKKWLVEQAVDFWTSTFSRKLQIPTPYISHKYTATDFAKVDEGDDYIVLKTGDGAYHKFVKMSDNLFVEYTYYVDEVAYNNSEGYVYIINNMNNLIIKEQNQPLMSILNDFTSEKATDYLKQTTFLTWESPVEYTVQSNENSYDINVYDTSSNTSLGDYRVTQDGWIGRIVKDEVVDNHPEDDTTSQSLLWDEDRSVMLSSYLNLMDDTTYRFWNLYNMTTFDGAWFPMDVINQLVVDGERVTAEWGPGGFTREESTYAVVDVASNNDYLEQNGLDMSQAKYYLFAIVDGTPVVLENSSTERDENGNFHFNLTSNDTLRNQFYDLAVRNIVR